MKTVEEILICRARKAPDGHRSGNKKENETKRGNYIQI